MYAVIEDSGTQIMVREGDQIKVDPRELSDEDVTLRFDRVLMVGPDAGDDEQLRLGQPHVAGASVEAEILSEERGDKIEVVKFKRRKRYTRRNGHRQPYIAVLVAQIDTGDGSG